MNKYDEPVHQLLTLGQPARELDYTRIGIEVDHVPELIRMLRDQTLHEAIDSDAVWAPVHAWRALGQFRAESAIVPLIELLPRVDNHDDDWVLEDLPNVFASIGTTAIDPLVAILTDDSHGLWARVTSS